METSAFIGGMSYLLDFVKTLDEAELEKLKSLYLIGKEEAIRDVYVTHAKDKKFSEDALPAKLGLSQSHFDKINSVLLDKVITHFYKDDYRLLLQALVLKGLSSLMLHEVKIAERKVLKQKESKGHAAFYKTAYETVVRMFFPHYDRKATMHFGQKYLQALGDKKTIGDEAYIVLLTHQADMISQSVAGNEETYRAAAKKVVDEWAKKLEGEKNPQANFILQYTIAQYEKYYGSDVGFFLSAMNSSLAYLDKCNAELKSLYKLRLLCELGFGNVESNNFEKAYQYYMDAFELSNTEGKLSSYHALMYASSAILANRLKEAKEIGRKYLEPCLIEGVNRSMRFDALFTLFTIQLHLKDYDKAFEYLTDIRSYKRNEVARMSQIYLRHCETLYFYLTRQYDMALSFANKNLKFLKRPENAVPQNDYFLRFTNCVVMLVKQKQRRLQSERKLQEELKLLRPGLYDIYNRLLQNG